MKQREHTRLRAAASTILGGAVAVALATPALSFDVTQGRLDNADNEPQNWLMGFQNYSSHSYSRLSQINRGNVANLKMAFIVPLSEVYDSEAGPNFEARPLVDDGFMFTDSGNGIFYKIDLRSGIKGSVVWKADAAVSPDEGNGTRGITMWMDAIYHNLRDGRVVGVDRTSGEFIWDTQIARVQTPKHSGVNVDKEYFSASPIAAEGYILVGQSGGDRGTRGWLAAVDAVTGDEMWRTYTIPGPGEFGHETWADDHGAWKTGGASLWTTGSYDPAQRITIWGGAQPVPMFDPEFRPGDNLYSNAAIAFDIDTGEIKWHFQYTPNESWDYDENGVHLIIDAPFNGKQQKMVTHWARNGFYYQLDATNGNFLSASQWVDKVTWTAGIDPKSGMPVEYDPNLLLQTYIPATRWARADTEAKTACPPLPGGARWQPPAYNPVKMLTYQGGEDGCQTFMIIPAITLPDGGIDEQGRRKPGTRGPEQVSGQVAMADVITGEVLKRIRYTYPNKAGILATGGGVLFTGYEDGALVALHDETLEELWRFESGIGIKAGFMTYAIGGQQFVAIQAGARTVNREELGERTGAGVLLVFTL